MHLKHIIAVALISFACLPCANLGGGKTIYTERSVEELKLMTTPELAGEARLVCHDIALSEKYSEQFRKLGSPREGLQLLEQSKHGRRYLERIGFVLRDRHQGKMPPWFDQVGQALKSENGQSCNEAATAGGWRPKE